MTLRAAVLGEEPLLDVALHRGAVQRTSQTFNLVSNGRASEHQVCSFEPPGVRKVNDERPPPVEKNGLHPTILATSHGFC